MGNILRVALQPLQPPLLCPYLSGVSTGVDAQEASVLIAVVVGGGVVHPVVPTRGQRGPTASGHGCGKDTVASRAHAWEPGPWPPLTG